MTKSEMIEMANKLLAQAEALPDEAGTDGTNDREVDKETPETAKPTPEGNETGDGGAEEPAPESNDNGEIEEQEQIEPQTNGKITDDITPKVDTQFENPTDAKETTGIEQVLGANLDQRFATMQQNFELIKQEVDKQAVVLAEIMTRIELVQEITDKVTTVDHDSLLSESIKLIV